MPTLFIGITSVILQPRPYSSAISEFNGTK